MTEAIDLKPAERRLVQDLISAHLPGVKVWAFGSRVTFKARPDSDLDLVAFAGTDRKAALASLREAFEESSLPFRVDLLNWDELPGDFKKNIEEGEVSPLAPDSLATPAGSPWGCSSSPLERLGSFCTKIGSGMTPRGGSSVYQSESKVALVRSQNIYNDGFVPSGLVFLREEDAELLKNVALEAEDILLNITGDSVARCCIIPTDILPARVNQHVLIIRTNKLELNPKFIRYYLVSKEVQQTLLAMAASGATRNALTKGMIEDFMFPKPCKQIQDKIAAILSSLDDKIALNRATNQTLEQIAQALFKSWFVDFDPVRAKARGEKPLGMDEATAALFPDGFEDSELGEIPRGWEVKSLDDIADYLNGLALQKFPAIPGKPSLPVIKIAELKQGNSRGSDMASSEMPPEYIIQDGDVIFSWSGSLFVDTWCGGPGALNQHLFKVSSEVYPKWLYLLWTKHHLEGFQRIAADKAVTMGHIKRGHLSEAKCCVPLPDDASKFSRHFVSLLDRQILLRRESNELEQIRDSLLPKLLSGEISVGEAAEKASQA